MMSRPKVYTSNSARTAAYRERLRAKQQVTATGWTDAELGQAVRDLHLNLAAWAAADPMAAKLLGATPLETLCNVRDLLESERA